MRSIITHTQLDALAAREIPPNLDAWPAIKQRLSARRQRRFQLRAATVLALALVLLAASVQSFSTPETVSAQNVLDRAGAASDGVLSSVHTFHIVATTTFTPGEGVPGGAIVEREETWYAAPDRMRQETQAPDWSTAIVRGAGQTWWAVTRAGKTYYAPADGVRLSDTARLNPLATQDSTIGGVLAFLHQHGCGTARLEPDATVAGRQTYVVSVPHTFTGDCVDPLSAVSAPSPVAVAADAAKKATALASMPEKARVAASPGPTKSEPVDADIARRLSATVVDTFWIDKQTFVPLRAQQTNGIKGTSVYEVTSASFDISVPESVFRFVPPAGALRLSDPAAVKMALANSLKQ